MGTHDLLKPKIKPKNIADLFGVRAKPRNAKDRLLEKAITRFYTTGFNAVGIDQILADVGVTKTTFYKYFESRDDLIMQAIKQREEWEGKAWARAMKKLGGPTPRGQLVALVDVLDFWFNDPSFGGCIFINVASEFPNPNDPIHKMAVAYKTNNRKSYADMARKSDARDPELFADLYTTMIEGMMILRHVHHRNDAAKVVKPMILRLIQEHMPSAA